MTAYSFRSIIHREEWVDMTLRAVFLTLAMTLPGWTSAPALADVRAGVEAWENGDYQHAIEQWRDPAEKGDASAQFNLAQAYRLGRGVPVDMKAAEQWYRKAALQGHADAEDNYGLALFLNGKQREAMPWIRKAAARGEPRALYVLGTASFNGDLAEKDWPRAYALLSRASALGISQATASLAQVDRFLSPEQRQRGLALAREAEIAPERQAMPAALKAPAAPFKPVLNAKSWRVQLGAFSTEANARTLWGRLSARNAELKPLEPYLMKSSGLTRLQAGPVAGKAAADALCAALARGGNACIPVAP